MPSSTADPEPATDDAARLVAAWRRRYRLALILVAILLSGSLATVVLAARAGDGNATQVNVSGRQRMLSQRVAFNARAAVRGDTESDRRAAAELLADARETMARAHDRLTGSGAEAAFARALDPDVTELYFGRPDMDGRVRAYLDSAGVVLEAVTSGAPAAQIVPHLSWITVQAQGPLLAGLDSVVAAHEVQGDRLLHGIERLAWIGWGAGLLLLAVLGGIVFAPFGTALGDAIRTAREREATVRATQHLHQVGLLATTVAHDLKNFAGVARGNLELLVEDLRRDGADAQMASEAIGSVERIELTARRLLALARNETAPVERLDAAGFTGGLLTLLRSAAHPAELSWSPARNGVGAPVRVRPREFESALVNLVANAGEAIAEHARGAGEVRISVERIDDQVVVSVVDDGPGIPSEIRARIFEPFFSAKKSGLGTGLGLAQVDDFARSAGGRVEVDAPTGGGARFRILLPVAGD